MWDVTGRFHHIACDPPAHLGRGSSTEEAEAFIADPIHGGKYIIQAKRYTNTVDVSAVRDLCAVVNKEGASRGILVTTSTYGADAYAFANNEPVSRPTYPNCIYCEQCWGDDALGLLGPQA